MRALVLSGGGSKGAFQVGALFHLLKDKGFKYDILTGISVGALNTAFLAQYPHGKEAEAAHDLYELWADLEDKKIYKGHCPFGKLHALCEPSVYDSSPLIKLVKSSLDTQKLKDSGKILRVGAVSLDTGEYREWTERDENIAYGVLASSSFPVMFTPIKIDGQYWTDGGVKEIAPLNTAIKLGADEIHVVLTSPSRSVKVETEWDNVVSVAKRVIDLMSDEILATDLIKLDSINRKVLNGEATDKRYIKCTVIEPDHILTEDSLDFDVEKLYEMIKKGYQKAIDILP